MVLLLVSCPVPERLDLPWFASTLAGLGPRFHAQAVRVALGIPGSAARTAAVLKVVGEGGLAVAVVLDELCPVPAVGGAGGVWSGGEALAHQVREPERERHARLLPGAALRLRCSRSLCCGGVGGMCGMCVFIVEFLRDGGLFQVPPGRARPRGVHWIGKAASYTLTLVGLGFGGPIEGVVLPFAGVQLISFQSS